jgi:hypothetical protein
MNTINVLLSTITQKQQKAFIKSLSKRNKRPYSNSLDILKSVINNNESQIKSEIGSNTYNVAINRLTDKLLSFTAQIIIEKDVASEIEILKLILVARKLFEYGKYKNAFKILKSTEKKAALLSDYSLLNEIYHTLIQYSYHELSPSQSEVFSKFESNQHNFLEQERVNMVYAVVQKAFKNIDNHSVQFNFSALITDTFSDFGISEDRAYNMKSLYQLAEIIDISSAATKSYSNVDLFFIDKLNKIKGRSLDNEKHLMYHIDLLHLIANIYFRQRKFDKAFIFLSHMKEQMERFDHKFFQARESQYTTLLALTSNYSGDFKQSETVLDNYLSNVKDGNLGNPLLTRAIIHFQQGEFQLAQRTLLRLNRSDQWYKKNIGIEWLLNKKYVEILLHIELNHIDYVDSKIKSLERIHKDYFKVNNSFQTLPFLKLVKAYFKIPSIVTTKDFENKVESNLNWEGDQQEDVFLISFYAWLKSKMVEKPLYVVTLELIEN